MRSDVATLRLAFVVGCIALGGLASPATSAASVDAPVDAGAVQLLNPDTRAELTSGDSNTAFTIGLPPDASCPGDSANDDWRIQSFLVPASDDPGALRYGIIRADGEGRFAIYTVQTQPYVHALTGQNPAPGLPGRIPTIPPLSFGVFPAGTLEMQNYRLGIACTLYRETAKFWDTEITLSAAPEVQPGEFRWQVVGAPVTEPVGDDGASVPPAIWAAAVAVAVGVAVLFVRSRRVRTSHQQADLTTKETV
ncbi:MAG TPA: hypothetical protein VK853_09660 [Ilumatobacteraceae bacterium]|nr:hypothetical protein [Ilumatobacteraceae bacterium]